MSHEFHHFERLTVYILTMSPHLTEVIYTTAYALRTMLLKHYRVLVLDTYAKYAQLLVPKSTTSDRPREHMVGDLR